MITIVISGPQGVGKTPIAMMIRKGLTKAGFVNFKIYTTNALIATDEITEEE